MSVCAEPGCPVLTAATLCRFHAARSSRNHRGVSRHDRGLGWEWERARATVLAAEPACYRCGRPATTVDHILPRHAGGTHERANLRGSCARHNYGRR